MDLLNGFFKKVESLFSRWLNTSKFYDQEIFYGIDRIPLQGYPSAIVVKTDKAQAVLTGETSGDIFMAAAEYGDGRVFVVSHESYYNWFNDTDTDAVKTQFVSNVKKWLTKSVIYETINVIEIKEVNERADLSQYQIVKWISSVDINEDIQSNLLEYLENGGALLCAATTLCDSDTKKRLSEMTMHQFLKKYIGIRLTSTCIKLNGEITVAQNLAKFGNYNEAVSNCIADPSKFGLYSCTIQRGIEALLSEEFAETIYIRQVKNVLTNEIKLKQLNVYPSEKTPVTGKLEKQYANLFCTCLNATRHEKAPSIDDFPGDFKDLPELLSNMNIRFLTGYKELLSTGFYLPAGVSIRVAVVAGNFNGWKLVIGAHSDDISQFDEYIRWPVISTTHDLDENVEVFSAFGGLVYFESPSKGIIHVEISNVLESPYYDVRKPETSDRWNWSHQNAAGLWTEIGGEHVIFTFPTKYARNLGDPKSFIDFWDSIVRTMYQLRGNDPFVYRRERVVTDKQSISESIHAGYPIIIHFGFLDENSKDYIFDVEKLKETGGGWKLICQFAHNLQRDEWTFDGSNEAIVNIFSMYSMKLVLGKTILQQPLVLAEKDDFESFFGGTPTYESWKESKKMAFMMFIQLVKHFGWEPIHKFFADYEEDIKHSRNSPKSNQDKIDQWVLRYSKIVNRNITAQFRMFGLPISDSISEQLNDLIIWCPQQEKDHENFFQGLN